MIGQCARACVCVCVHSWVARECLHTRGLLTHKSAVPSAHAGYSTLLQLQPGEQAKYTPYAQQVHGVLYQLSKQDLQKLAKAEGGYKLVDIEVGLPCFNLAWQLRLHAFQKACWRQRCGADRLATAPSNRLTQRCAPCVFAVARVWLCAGRDI